jgi:hypothetical protein
MRIALSCMSWLVTGLFIVGGLTAETPAFFGAGARASVVERFLSNTGEQLVSYRALRRLTAASRSDRMRASLTAWTSFDPEDGFQYEVVQETGSGMIRSRVLRAALEAEREVRARGDTAKGALSEMNYEFGAADTGEDPLVTVAIRPRRQDTLLVNGFIVLTRDEADLVRLEGTLVKRPSFWTRRIDVIREYARVAGVRVPVSMASTADVLIAGRSTFSMDYEYETINGQRVAPPVAASAPR